MLWFYQKKNVNILNAFDRWTGVNRISERREADAHWAVQDSIRYTQSHTRWYFQLHFSVWVHWIYIEYIIQHIGLFKIASFVRGFGEVTLKTDSRKGAGPIFHTVDKTQYKRVSCPESQQIISQRYWFSSWSMHVLLIQKLKSISTKSALQLSERSNHFKSTVKSTGTCSQR